MMYRQAKIAACKLAACATQRQDLVSPWHGRWRVGVQGIAGKLITLLRNANHGVYSSLRAFAAPDLRCCIGRTLWVSPGVSWKGYSTVTAFLVTPTTRATQAAGSVLLLLDTSTNSPSCEMVQLTGGHNAGHVQPEHIAVH